MSLLFVVLFTTLSSVLLGSSCSVVQLMKLHWQTGHRPALYLRLFAVMHQSFPSYWCNFGDHGLMVTVFELQLVPYTHVQGMTDTSGYSLDWCGLFRSAYR